MTHQNTRGASPMRRAVTRILFVAASCLLVAGVGAQGRGPVPATFGRPRVNTGLAIRAGIMPLKSTPTAAPPCVSDQDCSDGVFCNGIERCIGSGNCVSGTPPCGRGQRCDEDRNRCDTACPDTDHDGDGHRSIRCGGDDCDDNDPNRYPGRQEVCDAEGHDEDCDPSTNGHRDLDGDGEDDIRCCNRDANGALHCGTDYDDDNPAIRVGSMICDGGDAVVVFFSSPSFLSCPQGTRCVVQPNKTGICIVPPAGYVPPGRFVPPPPPPERPGLPALTALLSFENMAPVRGGTEPTPGKQRSESSVTVAPSVVSAAKDSAGGIAAEVAECKSILQSGKVSWGGGTSWAPGNIDNLCNGTKNARNTIACFQSNVEAMGWAAAIDKCK
jgi:hypothetical protein